MMFFLWAIDYFLSASGPLMAVMLSLGPFIERIVNNLVKWV